MRPGHSTIGVPGASELPSFVAVEITKDVRSFHLSQWIKLAPVG
jgi:hypothetical protein